MTLSNGNELILESSLYDRCFERRGWKIRFVMLKQKGKQNICFML